MASGTKKMIISTRERAVSTDIVRLQSFTHAAIGELMRHLLLSSTSEASAGGVATVPSAAAAPMPALILAGFMCRPQRAIDANPADLYVDGGELVAVAVDAAPDPDDSACKIMRDPVGMQTPGALQFLAAGVSTRVDVVEVSWVDSTDPSTVVETASRDVYVPSTGAFTSAVLPKAVEGKVRYRIRRGVEGTGFPGVALGWLPLMVAIVPVGATNWDGCAIYDVRPLLADRADLGNTSQLHAPIVDARASLTGTTLKGMLAGRYGASLAGGVLPVGGVDLATVGLTGWIGDAGSHVLSLFAAFPLGLPRWCRYVDAPALRVPGGFRGILVGTAVRSDLAGAPAAPVALPQSLQGLAATTSAAVLLGAVAGNGSGGGAGALVQTIWSGEWTRTANTHGTTASGSGGATPNAYQTFALDDAAGDYPAAARELLLEFSIAMVNTGASDGSTNIEVEVEVDGVRFGAQTFAFNDPVAGTVNMKSLFQVPMKAFYPDTTSPQTGGSARSIKFYANGFLVGAGYPSHGGQTMRIKGWRL